MATMTLGSIGAILTTSLAVSAKNAQARCLDEDFDWWTGCGEYESDRDVEDRRRRQTIGAAVVGSASLALLATGVVLTVVAVRRDRRLQAMDRPRIGLSVDPKGASIGLSGRF
jgi:hypothetical protein